MNKREKVISLLQKIGKALMVPIAVMPALGLLLRLGEPDLLGHFQLFKGWLGAAENAAFGTNMAILFAIGIGFGLSEENNGVGGLAGFLGYSVMSNVTTAINPSIDLGVFGGIIAGIVGALLYNKFKDIQVPQILGFFGGKRFVPIVTSTACLILGLIFSFIWPVIQIGLDNFTSIMVAMGAALYGILNRLLIPIGLHHILNTVIWFQLGSFIKPNGVIVNGDIARYLAGDPTAGVYTAGFYPIMMFGLPAACLAMYIMAKKERKKEVAGMFISLALIAVITGITEPIEFSFMFLSPILYGIHAILMGISMAVTKLLGILHSFSFSAGLIDYIIFIYFIKKFNLKTPGREEEVINSTSVDLSNNELSKKAEIILAALGGKENIEVLDNCITRLRLTVKDS